MVLGTQWYILFNVIAGASAMPADCGARRAIPASAAGCGGGASIAARRHALLTSPARITASGGSWNAAIVKRSSPAGEHHRVQARGLGAYIATATAAGDYHRIVLGIATMCLFVAS